MVDAYVSMEAHEERNVFATLTPASGTLTLSSATVTLYDTAGEVAGGVNGATATGITAGASSAPQAWYLFKPTTLSLTPGRYVLSFRVTDSSGYVYEPTVGVKVGTDYS